MFLALLLSPSLASAQLCGPEFTPPFEGTPITMVIANLGVVIVGYIAISGLIRRGTKRIIAGIGVFALGIFIVTYVSIPFLVHVERPTDQIIANNKLEAPSDELHAFCYRGIECPIIPLNQSDLDNNPRLNRLIAEGQRYPYHILVNWYEKESIVSTILKIAERQPAYSGNTSSAIFRDGSSRDIFVLNHNGDYFRIFITYEMASHYAGTVPFTYHTSEILLWNASLFLFFLLLNWKLPIRNRAVDSMDLLSKRNLALVGKSILCEFLARRNIKKSIPAIALLSVLGIVLATIGRRPDILAVFIDALIIMAVYGISILTARHVCRDQS